MSSTQPTTTPNRELIDGLRELADFLEQHPELPAFHGHVGHNAYGKNAREQMTAMARALGSRAIERPDSLLGEQVEILSEFGTVVLRMGASVRDLGGSSVPAHLSYAPILSDEKPSTCGRVMVGSGTGTYDPLCDLLAGHAGLCKSMTAVGQHHRSES